MPATTLVEKVTGPIPSRRAALLCFAAALAVFTLESVAWPLANGRDATTYLMYYADMWHAHPAFPALMLFRTPLAPLVYGPLLQLGGPILAEAAMAVAYATSILAFATAAAEFGRVAAIVTAVALLAYPGYGALFHEVSSDPIFAFVYALWTLGMIRTVRRPRAWKFGALGAGVLLLVLARPGAQALVLFVIVPLVLQAGWRVRLVWAGSFLGSAIAALALWSGYNELRYGDFVVARAGWANIPFYRVFVMEKLVRAENGPASRRLAEAIRRDLLTKRPYPQLRITTADQFFVIGSDHMWSDVVYLTDREWGWGSDYAILRRVSLEAIRRHTHLYARDVAAGVWAELRYPYQLTAAQRPRAPSASPRASTAARTRAASTADPGGRYWWLASTPDGSPPVRSRVSRLTHAVEQLGANLPHRSGSSRLATVLNWISRAYPWAALWLAVSAAGLVLRRPAGTAAILATAGLALLMITFTQLGEPPGLEYGLPFQPAFVLCGVAAVTATGGRASRVTRALGSALRRRRVRPMVEH